MKYKVNHDIHIHTFLSICSNIPEQNKENILKYAEANNYDYICLTDHCWGSVKPCNMDFYNGVEGKGIVQDIPYIKRSLPLPQGKECKFYFGCETDMDKEMNIGLTKEDYDNFDFVIIPTTHLHMFPFVSVEESKKAYIDRWEKLLSSDLPFHKIGLAHLTCHLIAPQGKWKDVCDSVTDEEYIRLFTKSKEIGIGIELNADDLDYKRYTKEEMESTYRVFRLAKKCGCKFYLGSDAHSHRLTDIAPDIFENAIEVLGLTEDDKFNPFKD